MNANNGKWENVQCETKVRAICPVCVTPQPTARPTIRYTPRPTPRPTIKYTPRPTPRPTIRYTPRPTPKPTPRPTHRPTPRPTIRYTPRPTSRPTPKPTPRPTIRYTPRPTNRPTEHPTVRYTPRPTPTPTHRPTPRPTPRPTIRYTPRPTPKPTVRYTPRPTPRPTARPTYGQSYTPRPTNGYINRVTTTTEMVTGIDDYNYGCDYHNFNNGNNEAFSYVVSDERYNFNEAQQYCMNNYGSNPVSIINAGNNHKIFELCQKHGGHRDCWIGVFVRNRKCNMDEGHYNNHNNFKPFNNQITYRNWASHEPTQGNGCCAAINQEYGTWENHDCRRRLRVVCPGLNL